MALFLWRIGFYRVGDMKVKISQLLVEINGYFKGLLKADLQG